MLPGLNVTSIPLNGDVPPSPAGTLAPAVSYKLIKLDQTEGGKEGPDPTPKFMLAGADANEPLLPPAQSKHLRNRKVSGIPDSALNFVQACCVLAASVS